MSHVKSLRYHLIPSTDKFSVSPSSSTAHFIGNHPHQVSLTMLTGYPELGEEQEIVGSQDPMMLTGRLPGRVFLLQLLPQASRMRQQRGILLGSCKTSLSDHAAVLSSGSIFSTVSFGIFRVSGLQHIWCRACIW